MRISSFEELEKIRIEIASRKNSTRTIVSVCRRTGRTATGGCDVYSAFDNKSSQMYKMRYMF